MTTDAYRAYVAAALSGGCGADEAERIATELTKREELRDAAERQEFFGRLKKVDEEDIRVELAKQKKWRREGWIILLIIGAAIAIQYLWSFNYILNTITAAIFVRFLCVAANMEHSVNHVRSLGYSYAHSTKL